MQSVTRLAQQLKCRQNMMFMVLSPWPQLLLEFTSSLDECRLIARWLMILKPSQMTWDVSASILGCYCPQPQLSFIISHVAAL